ncbi:hypothetical protein QYR01_20060 [Brucella anthropi]|uniref:hypothetical protein n=1 Tax=Brucella anthropi TaxID=529 RepID=UPI002671DBFA|nr:hypothetical protein [Brucella anthropi]WKT93740.1 hypothetical protein QYR01_20060 [Brucella anthropi]
MNETVFVAIKVLAGLAKIAKSALSLNERRLMEGALEKLSHVYFFDDRSVALLKRVSTGEAISSESVERAIGGFAMSENPVREALELLIEFESVRGSKLGIEARNGLRMLSNHKMDVRIAVWEFLHRLADNNGDEQFRQAHREEAGRLLDMIQMLNAQISLIDKDLRGQR